MDIEDFVLGAPHKSEFEPIQHIAGIFDKHNLPIGRMRSSSKSLYSNKYPNNIVVFNANIITYQHGKVWHGDLDVNRDLKSLVLVAQELEESLFILSEHDARFGSEKDHQDFLVSRAVVMVSPKGHVLVRTKLD